MDDADKASPLIENAIQDGIEHARRAPMLTPKGACWYCEERLAHPLRFCNKVCADDFQAEEEAIKRAGR